MKFSHFSVSQYYKELWKNKERFLWKTIFDWLLVLFIFFLKKGLLFMSCRWWKIACHLCRYGIIRKKDINEINILTILGSILIYWRKEETTQGSRKVSDKGNTIKFHYELAREELNEMHCLWDFLDSICEGKKNRIMGQPRMYQYVTFFGKKKNKSQRESF